MKTSKNLYRVISIAFIMFLSTSVFAQFSQVGNVLSTGVNDAQTILKAYVSPFANGTGASLSGGWYNSAKPHKLGGFDVTVTANLVFIPSSDKTFDPNTLGLGDPTNGINVTIGGNESPTVAGSKSAGPQVEYTKYIAGVGDVPFTKFNLPKGSNLIYSFMPMVQAGIGLVKGTEVDIRYSPEINYGKSGKIGLWGVGLKHDVLQWIPVLSKLPVLNISLQGGYTKLTSINDLNFQASFYDDIPTVNNTYIFPTIYNDQQLQMGISNTTANLLVSANLPVIVVYGGVGVSATSTQLKLAGTYPFVSTNGTLLEINEDTDVTDPIDMKIKSTDVRLNAGFRIKMAVVTIHFDYTYANYSIATAGLGVALR